MPRDYYRTLEVERSASRQEIKKSYQKLAKKWHPDVNKAPEAEDKFKEITEAYEVLGSEAKRQRYDDQLKYESARQTYQSNSGSSSRPSGNRPGPEAGSTSDRTSYEYRTGTGGVDEDFFDMFFGDRMKDYDFFSNANGNTSFSNDGSTGAGPQRTTRAKLDITLEQAYRGDHVPIRLGARRIQIKIPERISQGSTIRIRGTGTNGIDADEELLITLRILPHSVYVLEGSNLQGVLEVAPWEAALGADAHVQLPDQSRVRVKVPPGIQTGRILRILGRGLRRDDGSYGDVLLDVEIVVPPGTSEQERELYRQMASLNRYQAQMRRRR